MPFKYVLACVLTVAVSNSVIGQRNSIVQLPSIQRFSIGTTVLVPDRGGAYAGGVNRSWQSSRRLGTPFFPGGARASNRGASASGVSVHAHIHDLEEMDAHVLQQWEQMKVRSTQPRLTTFPKPVSPTASTTIREARNKQKSADASRSSQAHADFQAGWRMERQGKLGSAKIFYRMALKRADSVLREKIVSRLDLLSTPQIALQR